jgi:flagellar L-ring protein precursor FlgH
MNVNGEETTIRVRGRVRPADISRGNQVLSTRIADAQIDYDGRGFVSRNARPGLVHRLFSLLGLAG